MKSCTDGEKLLDSYDYLLSLKFKKCSQFLCVATYIHKPYFLMRLALVTYVRSWKNIIIIEGIHHDYHGLANLAIVYAPVV